MLTAANIQKRLQWAEKYRNRFFWESSFNDGTTQTARRDQYRNRRFLKWVDVDEKRVSCY
jgi:hypothetical protein